MSDGTVARSMFYIESVEPLIIAIHFLKGQEAHVGESRLLEATVGIV